MCLSLPLECKLLGGFLHEALDKIYGRENGGTEEEGRSAFPLGLVRVSSEIQSPAWELSLDHSGLKAEGQKETRSLAVWDIPSHGLLALSSCRVPPLLYPLWSLGSRRPLFKGSRGQSLSLMGVKGLSPLHEGRRGWLGVHLPL